MRVYTLGTVIKEKRISSNIEARDICNQIHTKVGKNANLSLSYYYDIESDKKTPSNYILRQISNILGISFNYLLVLADIIPFNISMNLDKLNEEECLKALEVLITHTNRVLKSKENLNDKT